PALGDTNAMDGPLTLLPALAVGTPEPVTRTLFRSNESPPALRVVTLPVPFRSSVPEAPNPPTFTLKSTCPASGPVEPAKSAAAIEVSNAFDEPRTVSLSFFREKVIEPTFLVLPVSGLSTVCTKVIELADDLLASAAVSWKVKSPRVKE